MLLVICFLFTLSKFSWWIVTFCCIGLGDSILGSSGVQFPWFRNDVIIGGFRDILILLTLPVLRLTLPVDLQPEAEAVRPLFGGRETREWAEVLDFDLSVFIFLSFWLQEGWGLRVNISRSCLRAFCCSSSRYLLYWVDIYIMFTWFKMALAWSFPWNSLFIVL